MGPMGPESGGLSGGGGAGRVGGGQRQAGGGPEYISQPPVMNGAMEDGGPPLDASLDASLM